MPAARLSAAALAMLKRRGNKNKRATVGADKGYDSKAFIKGRRKLKVTPHVAVKDRHSAVDARITRTRGLQDQSGRCASALREAFGWIKTVGGLAGQATVRPSSRVRRCCALPPTTLVRMGSIGGWWDAHHA